MEICTRFCSESPSTLSKDALSLLNSTVAGELLAWHVSAVLLDDHEKRTALRS